MLTRYGEVRMKNEIVVGLERLPFRQGCVGGVRLRELADQALT